MTRIAIQNNFSGKNPDEPASNQDVSRLIDVEKGTQVKIASYEGGQAILHKLNQIGIFPGDLARVIRFAPFHGPVLLEVRGMEIALGRGIAARILVEVAACDLP
jgi:ferrous iron transport protein A